MRSSRLSHLIGLCSLATFLSACGDTSHRAADDAIVRSDSAGVEIIRMTESATDVPVIATLDTVTVLRLGSLQDPPQAQFGALVEVLPLSDGGFAVLDAQAAQVRVFDRSGQFRSALGARGDGPGEFQRPTTLAVLPGDTFAVFDSRSRRVTRFGPGGTVSDVTLQDVQSRIVEAAFLRDGSLVGQSRWLAPGGASPPSREPSFVRDTAVLTVFDRTGVPRDTVDVVAGQESVQYIEVSPQAVSVWKRPALFGRTNVFAVHTSGVWSSTNDRFELRLRAQDGRLVRIIRAPGLERPVTDRAAENIYEEAVSEADVPEERRQVDTWYSLSPHPELQPAYDDIAVDDRGRLWVRAWSGVEQPTRWWVFEESGRLLGAVQAPREIELTAVTCTDLWGIERDELNVEYVVRYALRGMPGCA